MGFLSVVTFATMLLQAQEPRQSTKPPQSAAPDQRGTAPALVDHHDAASLCRSFMRPRPMRALNVGRSRLLV